MHSFVTHAFSLLFAPCQPNACAAQADNLAAINEKDIPYSYKVSTVIMFDLFQDFFFWKFDLFYEHFLRI